MTLISELTDDMTTRPYIPKVIGESKTYLSMPRFVLSRATGAIDCTGTPRASCVDDCVNAVTEEPSDKTEGLAFSHLFSNLFILTILTIPRINPTRPKRTKIPDTQEKEAISTALSIFFSPKIRMHSTRYTGAETIVKLNRSYFPICAETKNAYSEIYTNFLFSQIICPPCCLFS